MVLSNQKINNVLYDFSCITLNIAGATFTGIQSVNWTDARDHVAVYGAGSLPLGVTPGQWAGSGSLEMILSDYNSLYKILSAFYDSEFSMSVVYSLGGNLPIQENLTKCVFLGRNASMSVGSDPLLRSMDFIMLEPVKTDQLGPNAATDSFLGDIFRGANVIQNVVASV